MIFLILDAVNQLGIASTRNNDEERLLNSLGTYGYPSCSFMMISHNAYIFQFDSLRRQFKPITMFRTTWLCLISIFGPVCSYLQYNQSMFGLLFQKNGTKTVNVGVYLTLVSSKKSMNFFLLHENHDDQKHLQCLFLTQFCQLLNSFYWLLKRKVL